LQKLSNDKLGKTLTGMIWVVGFAVLAFTDFYPSAIIFITIFLTGFLLLDSGDSYNVYYKKRIFPLILKFFGDFTYKAKGEGISLNFLGYSDIFSNYNYKLTLKPEVEDYIKGVHENIGFEIEEMCFKVSDLNHNTKIFFQGLVIILRFPKAFKSSTAIHYGPAKRGILEKIFGNQLERVKLNNPKFEKLFDVYGSDPIQSRLLLTSELMEAIFEINEIWGGEILLEFKNDHLLISRP
jgi:hypothetical protein